MKSYKAPAIVLVDGVGGSVKDAANGIIVLTLHGTTTVDGRRRTGNIRVEIPVGLSDILARKISVPMAEQLSLYRPGLVGLNIEEAP